MNKKYNYDIDVITDLLNEGLSLRQVARNKGWSYNATQAWIKRNFWKEITYHPVRD